MTERIEARSQRVDAALEWTYTLTALKENLSIHDWERVQRLLTLQREALDRELAYEFEEDDDENAAQDSELSEVESC